MSIHEELYDFIGNALAYFGTFSKYYKGDVVVDTDVEIRFFTDLVYTGDLPIVSERIEKSVTNKKIELKGESELEVVYYGFNVRDLNPKIITDVLNKKLNAIKKHYNYLSSVKDEKKYSDFDILIHHMCEYLKLFSPNSDLFIQSWHDIVKIYDFNLV